MSTIKLLVVISILIGLFSCESSGPSSQLPALYQCDSAVVMYYKEVGNPRFFTMAKVYDSTLLFEIATDANAGIRNTQDTCSSEGKIYYYGDKGEVYVLYFSRSNSCQVIRFIKTGEKFEVAMSKRVATILDSLQPQAYEPSPVSFPK